MSNKYYLYFKMSQLSASLGQRFVHRAEWPHGRSGCNFCLPRENTVRLRCSADRSLLGALGGWTEAHLCRRPSPRSAETRSPHSPCTAGRLRKGLLQSPLQRGGGQSFPASFAFLIAQLFLVSINTEDGPTSSRIKKRTEREDKREVPLPTSIFACLLLRRRTLKEHSPPADARGTLLRA